MAKYKKYKTINKLDELENEAKTPNKLKIIVNSLLNNTLDYKMAKRFLIEFYKNDEKVITIQEFLICVTIISKLESEEKNRVSK